MSEILGEQDLENITSRLVNLGCSLIGHMSSDECNHLHTQIDCEKQRLIASHRALQAERDALKAQHDDLVLRNRLLRDRTDLPIERLQAYDDLMKQWDALKAELAEAREICSESYQVVGSLSFECGMFEDSQTQRVLDNLSQCRKVHEMVLPYTINRKAQP